MEDYHVEMDISKRRSPLLWSARAKLEKAREAYQHVDRRYDLARKEEILGGVIETREEQERKRRRTGGQ